jgi:hypothetical protein
LIGLTSRNCDEVPDRSGRRGSITEPHGAQGAGEIEIVHGNRMEPSGSYIVGDDESTEDGRSGTGQNCRPNRRCGRQFQHRGADLDILAQ